MAVFAFALTTTIDASLHACTLTTQRAAASLQEISVVLDFATGSHIKKQIALQLCLLSIFSHSAEEIEFLIPLDHSHHLDQNFQGAKTAHSLAPAANINAKFPHLKALTILLFAIRLLAVTPFFVLTDHFGFKGLH